MTKIIKFPGVQTPVEKDSERLMNLHLELDAAIKAYQQTYLRMAELHVTYQQALQAIVFFHGVHAIPDKYLEFFYPDGTSPFQLDFNDVYDW